MRLIDNRVRRGGLAVGVVALATAAILSVLGLANHEEPVPKPASARPTIAMPLATLPGAVARDVGRPERLTIGAIGVDAAVTQVGMTPGHAQGVPASIDATGWWRDGVRPGRSGNAVIVGHTASAADGVFDGLGKLRRGETVAVRSARGTLHFDVTRVMNVKVADFSRIASRVYRADGAPGLVLMTCGDWNGKNYASTTIVFSTLRAD